MHAKFERLLSKSLTTLEVMAYYLVVHTGPGLPGASADAFLLSRASLICVAAPLLECVLGVSGEGSPSRPEHKTMC